MARAEGTVTLVGMPPVGETLTLPAIQAVFSGKQLAGSVGRRRPDPARLPSLANGVPRPAARGGPAFG
jgi:D-arabinose 1-dehydrogenase-like Zn-dependent alcohol dehydrogenase